MSTRIGKLTLTNPCFRNRNFSTILLKEYQETIQAFVLVMIEMVVNGTSTC